MENEGIFMHLGGRKFTYALFGFIASTIFVVSGKMDMKMWTEFVSILGTIYVIGNVGSTYLKK
jgi:hypothetical protein